METIQNILGMLVLVIFILSIGLIVYSNNFTSISSNYESEEQKFIYAKHSTAFDTILLVHDNSSSLTLTQLTSLAAFDETEIINNSGVLINVSNEYEQVFDKVYGKNNYHLTIKPKVADVSLNFVIDGSSTLQDEREKLAQELPGLLNSIKTQNYINGQEKIIANVFILGRKDGVNPNSNCNIFNDLYNAEITCKILDNIDLYERPEIVQGIETDDFNNYKIDYNILPPYNNREEQVHSVRGDGNIKDYYEADWGSGVSYVSAFSKDTARLVLIFPMSDELSTSSISEDCFDNTLLGKGRNQEFREQKVCDFCKTSCDDPNSESIQRAYKTIETAAEIAKDNGHVVYPIFAYDCDYPYNTQTFNGYFDYVMGNMPSTTACAESVCGGCTEDANQNICFHPECEQYILNHMEYLANETQGEIINLETLEDLINSVQNGILSTLNSFEINVGKKQERKKFVYQRSIAMDNKLFTDIILEVYYDINDMSKKDYQDYLDSVKQIKNDTQGPIISVNTPTNGDTVNTKIININGLSSDLNGIKDITFYCTFGCKQYGIANGTTIFNINNIELKEGINTILFRGMDKSNNSNVGEYIYTITYEIPEGICENKKVHCIGDGQEFRFPHEALSNDNNISPGDLFKIYSGTYDINSTLKLSSNLSGSRSSNPTKILGIGNVILDGTNLENDESIISIEGSINKPTKFIEIENIKFINSPSKNLNINFAEDIIIRNNKFENSEKTSVNSNFGSKIIIENSIITNSISGSCIILNNTEGGNIIKRNSISSCNQNSLFISNSPLKNTIEENKFFESGSNENNGNIVIDNSQSTTIQNNLLYRNNGQGIIIRNSANNNLIRHNTIYFEDSIERSPLQILTSSQGNIIYNNILISGSDNSNKDGSIELDSSTISSQLEITNNIYYREKSNKVITLQNIDEYTLEEFNNNYSYNDESQISLNTLNIFESFANNDYELKLFSPGIDNGKFNDLSKDIDSYPRPQNGIHDIGAFEKKIGKQYEYNPTCEEITIPLNPDDTVITLTTENASDLGTIISNAQPKTTFYFEDGIYDLRSSSDILIKADFTTLRSSSGIRENVIFDGGYQRYGFRINADNVTLTDITLKRYKYHPVHVQGYDGTVLHNIQIFDGGEQFIKINNRGPEGNREYSDNGKISCSYFELTDAGSTQVRQSLGAGSCYTGGIDMHAGWNWNFHDNTFKDIYCRNRIGLAEHAIHIWRNGKDNVVERNLFINNARGIGFGLSPGRGQRDYLPEDLEDTSYTKNEVEHLGGVIRNNVIYSNIGKKADSGISLEAAYGAEVYHNTAYMIGQDKGVIDSVYSSTKENVIKNNLLYTDNSGRGIVNFRGGAIAENNTNENNIEANSGMFESIANLNFKLKNTATDAIDKGSETGTFFDFENNPRDILPDIGAYEFNE